MQKFIQNRRQQQKEDVKGNKAMQSVFLQVSR